MGTPILVLIAAATLFACVSLGGGLYEALAVDPFWPERPGIVQPRNGGIARARFWLPVHIVFEVLVVVTLVFAWRDAEVVAALVVALVSHVAMRIWSAFDPIPTAMESQRNNPANVDAAAAVRWTRRSLLRLPLSLLACTAMLAALAMA